MGSHGRGWGAMAGAINNESEDNDDDDDDDGSGIENMKS